MRITLILLVFAGVFTLSSCKYFKEHRLFSKDVDTLLDAQAASPVSTSPVVDTTPIIEAPMPVAQPVAKSTSFGYGSDKFYMIVGSFQNKKLAEKYAEKVHDMGYQTQIIESEGGFYRVSAKSFSNYKTGVSEIGNFRSSVTSNAWLHVKK
jgi:hypothetical protein